MTTLKALQFLLYVEIGVTDCCSKSEIYNFQQIYNSQPGGIIQILTTEMNLQNHRITLPNSDKKIPRILLHEALVAVLEGFQFQYS